MNKTATTSRSIDDAYIYDVFFFRPSLDEKRDDDIEQTCIHLGGEREIYGVVVHFISITLQMDLCKVGENVINYCDEKTSKVKSASQRQLQDVAFEFILK